MINQGNMINVKRFLGSALAVMSFGFAFNIPQIQNLVMGYPIISILILAFSSFFLIKSGARK